ncbi:NAD(P)-dependent oxidoreductase [Gordonia rubripertincta]|uniref:NAD(P)-dependent oxidoreductase n=1 Tax=Gordonia rubripertincta TaxID=36822 RepID=A0ABT4MWL6_GORRU|nr:NAD(P)-dependent oxidoreductase [Gordonia rubripertincta]MCZ4551372.1 NAD(P)-dependent oxidoreductase [Gordonia rubripertincta]
MSERPNVRVAFVGLGNMGAQMSVRLLDAGYDVVGYDPSDTARRSFVDAGGTQATTAAGAIRGSEFVILMLPNSRVVELVLGDPDVVDALGPQTTVIDMSSSEPVSTVDLARAVSKTGAVLIDAPVSGGVAGAKAGTLTIMAGGRDDAVAQVRDLLAPLGTLTHVGDTGAGHALKSVNNLMAAVGLLVTSEGVAIGRRFGIDPALMVSMINKSSGQNAATDQKFPRYVLPETYDSGFALALMLKDMRIATGLAGALGVPAPLGNRAVEVWASAADDLGPEADQTEIARWTFDNASTRATP